MSIETQIKRLIHESNLIEGYDRPDFDKQSLLAWRWLMDSGIPFDMLQHNDIKKLQKMITLLQDDLRPDQRGYYRNMSEINVTIGGRLAPHYSVVDGLMGNWLLDYPTLTPKEAHIRFEHIHPFVDGNGRTGRMLMWWHELWNGLMMGMPFTVITKKDVGEYYDWFNEEKKGGKSWAPNPQTI
jgi:hypothetical protein